MSAADYIATFGSIVIGLAVADLATSLHRLIRARRRVSWDWLPLAAAALTLLLIIQIWWRFFQIWSATPSYSFGAFLPDLLAMLLLFFLAAAALPDAHDEHNGLNLREYYQDNNSYFWGLLACYVMTAMLMRIGRGPGFDGTAADIVAISWRNLIFYLLPSLTLALTRRRIVHVVLVLLMLAYSVRAWIGMTISS